MDVWLSPNLVAFVRIRRRRIIKPDWLYTPYDYTAHLLWPGRALIKGRTFKDLFDFCNSCLRWTLVSQTAPLRQVLPSMHDPSWSGQLLHQRHMVSRRFKSFKNRSHISIPGIHLTLFILGLQLLAPEARRSRADKKWHLLLIYMAFSFILGTLAAISSSIFAQHTFINNQSFPNILLVVTSQDYSFDIMMLARVVSVAGNWVTDSFMVH